jgi:hypothetical protein
MVTTMISSGVVIPATALRTPSSRKVLIPRSRARFRIWETLDCSVDQTTDFIVHDKDFEDTATSPVAGAAALITAVSLLKIRL